ncbi:MAG: CvpA family protein [Anaerolineae bacterium]|nr:CvpA family protein [Anaerolineae bacterium]
MINIGTMFWLLVALFAIMGTMRGWTKEVIATSGLILALFFVNQFGDYIMGFVGGTGDVVVDTVQVRRQIFYIFSLITWIIAFFSYQGPALAGGKVAARLRIRDSFQDKFMGLVVGGINGYLLIGATLSYLEYLLESVGNWVRLPAGVEYPFPPETIIRVDIQPLMNLLPMPLLAPYLPILLVIVFLFVIIVMI